MWLAGNGNGHRREFETSQDAQLKGEPAIRKSSGTVISHYATTVPIEHLEFRISDSKIHKINIMVAEFVTERSLLISTSL